MINPDNISVGTTIYFCFEDGSPGKGIIAGSGIDNWERPCYKVRVYKPHHYSRLCRIPKGRVFETECKPRFEMHWANVKVGWRVRRRCYMIKTDNIPEGELLQPLWQQFLKEHS